MQLKWGRDWAGLESGLKRVLETIDREIDREEAWSEELLEHELWELAEAVDRAMVAAIRDEEYEWAGALDRFRTELGPMYL